MPDRFDDIVRTVLDTGGPRYHEAAPEDFGETRSRLEMFKRCVALLGKRYPAIRVAVSGDRAGLMTLGVGIGNGMMIEGDYVAAALGPTDTPNRIRLTFSRR